MVDVRPLVEADRAWAVDLWRERWAGEEMISRGATHRVAALPGFVAVSAPRAGDGTRIGLLTYHVAGDAGEIVSLDSLQEGRGVGSALLVAMRDLAAVAGLARLWLITTNDNLAALRFYQKRGFELAALHRGAVAASRQYKPAIPLLGRDGIPLRDEIELERRCGDERAAADGVR